MERTSKEDYNNINSLKSPKIDTRGFSKNAAIEQKATLELHVLVILTSQPSFFCMKSSLLMLLNKVCAVFYILYHVQCVWVNREH